MSDDKDERLSWSRLRSTLVRDGQGALAVNRSLEGEAFCDSLEEVGGVDGLGESGEVVAGVAGFFKEVDGRGLSREEEHLALRELAGQGDGEIDAAHSGHDDVGDEELGSDPEGEGEGTG